MKSSKELIFKSFMKVSTYKVSTKLLFDCRKIYVYLFSINKSLFLFYLFNLKWVDSNCVLIHYYWFNFLTNTFYSAAIMLKCDGQKELIYKDEFWMRYLILNIVF